MLIDDITIRIKAGDGGNGMASFNRNMKSLGPVGGSGGNGGNVYFEGVSNLNALSQFRNKKDWDAQNGGNGRGQFVDGATGKDLVLKIPVGTIIHIMETGTTAEITKTGQQILSARGGKGGRGNFHFRSATNTSPRQFEKGTPGQSFTVRLELKLIADVGLVGLPNVGKSSLLNELTNARSKVANYQFTTLEPNLGSYYGLILADIPGLIEGASGGKGLGIKFLRHIERTKTIFHCIAADSANPMADYATVRQELTAYSEVLAAKPEHIIITRSDMVDDKQLKKIKKEFAPKKTLAVSIHDLDSLKELEKLLRTL